MLSEVFSTKQLKAEDNVNLKKGVSTESSLVNGFVIEFREIFFITSEQISKRNWTDGPNEKT